MQMMTRPTFLRLIYFLQMIQIIQMTTRTKEHIDYLIILLPCDIIHSLPLPDEICHKILLYAFKSPHAHLQEEIFKRAVPKSIYQKLVEKGEIETDAQGHITKAEC